MGTELIYTIMKQDVSEFYLTDFTATQQRRLSSLTVVPNFERPGSSTTNEWHNPVEISMTNA